MRLLAGGTQTCMRPLKSSPNDQAQEEAKDKPPDGGSHGGRNAALRPSSQLSDELLRERTVLLFGEISMDVAQAVCGQLLMLASRSQDPIKLVVNSPGGHVESGDSIFDIIRFIAPRVVVLGTGWVVSAAALVYAAARRENRLALPNTRFMLHQPLGGVGGPASDVDIEAEQIVQMRARLNQVFADATGQSLERIAKDTERNYWLTAQQAREYGLVGRIVARSDNL